ncbi:class I SAM-dependent methyltransferase [Lichenibacterium dinghuense]|uniref:class I SAM-dependent methyltransferase n=1 Tax=Lichenibacterium dinghuense TaxID=2895977 RepID=UPI001F2DB854|nr:50S ribosomal protein L11 methyltransferase [Lichenibacterium sp. 6Y81]
MPDRAAFIRRNTRLRPVPLVPEVLLHAADDATDLWAMTEADLDQANLPPPFWAFAWAGGQALARYVLDHPQEVRGARVLDFASGSGLVGIAAALAGAARVEAADIDGFALAAIALNAAENGVAVEARGDDLVGRDEGWDAVLVADVFYERDTAGAVTPWLRSLARRGARVIVGDPGRSYFDPTAFEPLAAYDVPVMRLLEDADVKRGGVWRVRG